MIPVLETAGFLVLAIRGLNKRHTRSTSPEFRMRHDWNSLLGTGWSLKPSPSIAMKGTCETISMLLRVQCVQDFVQMTKTLPQMWILDGAFNLVAATI